MLQWHPEYDTVSIAREYLRDKQKKEPHEPIGYLSDELRSLDPSKKYTNEYIEQVGNLKNNWRDSAQVMMARWISLVFKLTNNDIHKQYMEWIDPEDPLSILRK